MIVNAIEGMTRVFGKVQPYYNNLPVRDEVIDGIPYMTSSWTFTPEEAARVANGASLYLSIVGSIHPPVKFVIGPDPAPVKEDKSEIDAAIQKPFFNDLKNMTPEEVRKEYNQVSSQIDEETMWQEALAAHARINNIDLTE